MAADDQLIAEFVQSASQEAFAELVRRHIDCVYASARRQVIDPQTAEDVTQAVFIILARRAVSVRGRASLAGWLLSATRYAARDALKAQSRRRRHEAQAAPLLQSRREENMKDDAEGISSELDEAMAHLNEKERDAVTLRYLHGKSVAETAATLGISPEAAAKRVSRAVDRLRRTLAGRGVMAPGVVLGTVLERLPHLSAPAALVHAATLAGAGVTPSAAGLLIAKGASHMMAWTKAKIAAVIVAAAFVTAGAGVGGMKLLADDTVDAPPQQLPAPGAIVERQPAPAEANPAAPDLATGRLSNGVTVQVVGVCQSPSEGKEWWTPTGDPLAEAPYTSMHVRPGDDPGQIHREIAVLVNSHVNGPNGPATVIWNADNAEGSTSSNLGGKHSRDLGAISFNLPANLDTTGINANVAAGPWSKVMFNVVTGGSMSESFGDKEILVSMPYFANGQTHLVVATVGFMNFDCRLVVTNRAGKDQTASLASSVGTKTATITDYAVRGRIADFKSCVLETRPFDQWIRIQNVALRPGLHTEPKVTTSDDGK